MLKSDETLHIVSFNVAGWKTTLQKINTYFGSLENWLNALQIDILCLQEVKIQKKDIDKTLGAELEQYDSFWCAPTVKPLSDKEKKLKLEKHVQVKNGINGVTTFVRKGMVKSANSRILDDDDFNDEGRCLLTDHGSFVVFNVYVPYSGETYGRYASKMYFYELLEKAMERQRKSGKPVILCGDLNTSSKAIDCSTLYRYIDMKKLLSTNSDNNETIQKLQLNWNSMHECLMSINFEMEDEKKGKLHCILDDKKHYIDATSEEPIKDYFFGEILLCNDEYAVKESKSTEYILTKNNLYLTRTRADVNGNIPSSGISCSKKFYSILNPGDIDRSNLEKIWDIVQKNRESTTGKRMYLTSTNWEEIAIRFGNPCHSIAGVNWLNNLLSESNNTRMIDTFRSTYPNTEFRYTCWDQSTNRRYSNIGSRIDYILVDIDMWTQVFIDNQVALHNGVVGNENDLLSDKDKALRATTANFKFKEVTLESKGLAVPIDIDAIQLHTKHLPHTGIIYTPPDFSDHVAVAILIKRPSGFQEMTISDDKDTKDSQPHKKQTSITSFFALQQPTKKQKMI